MNPQLEGPDVAPRPEPEPEPIVTPPPEPKVSPEAENLFNQAEQNARNQLPPPPANRELIAPAIDQLDPNNQLIQKQNRLLDLQIAREERAELKDRREDAERQAREAARIAEIQNLRPEFVAGPTVNPAQNRILEIQQDRIQNEDTSVLDSVRVEGKLGNREPFSDQEINEIIQSNNLTAANAARLREINEINRTRSQAEQGSKEALNEYKNLIFESGVVTTELNTIADKANDAIVNRLALAWEGSETLAEVEALVGQYGVDGSVGIIQKVANGVTDQNFILPDITNEERQLVSLLASRPVAKQTVASERENVLREAARLFSENPAVLEEFSIDELRRLVRSELGGRPRRPFDKDLRPLVPDLKKGDTTRDVLASALLGAPVRRQAFDSFLRRGGKRNVDQDTNVEEQSAGALAQGEQAQRLQALGGQSAGRDTTTRENRLEALIREEKIGQGQLQTTEQIKTERKNLSKQISESENQLELRQAAPVTLAQDQRFFDKIPEGATPSSLWKSYSVPDSPVVYERTNFTTQPDLIQVPQSIRDRWETAIDNNQVNQAVFRELYLDAIGELTKAEYDPKNPAATLTEQQEFLFILVSFLLSLILILLELNY